VLLDEPSPVDEGPYKHREDLLDAALCAWTAAIWHRHGDRRTQVLGATAEPDAEGRRATIVAPARPEQRLAARPDGRRTGRAGAGERDARPAGPPSLDAALDAVRELRRLTTSLDNRLTALERDLRSLRKGVS
jgi:predicted RNase H-like nuclease